MIFKGRASPWRSSRRHGDRCVVEVVAPPWRLWYGEEHYSEEHYDDDLHDDHFHG